MKKLMALFVAVAFTAGIAGLVSAQTSTTPKEEKKPATEKSATEKKAPEKKMSSKSAKGTVKSASADSVVVAGKEKGKEAEWTFAVDPKTKIKKGGKDITAGDLKSGDQVSVRYMDHEGKAVAQNISVSGGSMAKKDAAKKTEAKPAEKAADKK